jgi:hypothetical protein
MNYGILTPALRHFLELGEQWLWAATHVTQGIEKPTFRVEHHERWECLHVELNCPAKCHSLPSA